MTAIEVRSIRESCGLSQSQLAHRMRVSVRAVQMWEQGLRRPGGPAVLMLETIGRELRQKPKSDTLSLKTPKRRK